MNSDATPEFSRLIPLARLGATPYRQQITASDAERAALTRRFDLVALDRLCATVELARQGDELFLLQAAFEAEFVQRCVVTLDPVGGAVAARFTLLYGPPEAEAAAEGGAADEIAFEPLAAAAIDVGEAVAQEFSLRLPAFPRRVDAAVEVAPPAPEEGAFAALSRLVERRER
ncbi:MAG TPA: YceD family protein [Stellaceae bacterium]|nr:YceD family protein [Stellaceae bacterium]